ncbi:MAG TPA: Smr/MutS family protein [Sphingomonas sp.]|jgi:DNA-nicking Smr family endonuclease|uniref:Smr/MutS family protein n=1 Tax=Sphingomonas sp. TaxID=28214 RepID=UPI002ED94F4C
MASVQPLRAVASAPVHGAVPAAAPVSAKALAPVARAKPVKTRVLTKPVAPPPPPAKVSRPGVTLDGGWDRRLTKGAVAPDDMIDLHGHSLASAHAMLDARLEQAVARGDRVVLLVTGKPPRPESERPHARGAIRAAVADWLASSRHAGQIAAVRGAHPRHGGAGALYIILRRARG